MHVFAQKPTAIQQARPVSMVPKGPSVSDHRVSAGSLISVPVHPPAPIQPKLEVSRPDDRLEQEADQVADKVMRMHEVGVIGASDGAIQRCACQEGDNEELGASQGISGGSTGEPFEDLGGEAPVDQVAAVPVEDEQVSLKAESSSGPATLEAPQSVHQKLLDRRASGERMPETTRKGMERAFGCDFSRVRIHRDAAAANLSADLHAHAFAHRNEIYFGHGKFAPDQPSGKRLLAHELTHVVQQGFAPPVGRSLGVSSGGGKPQIQRDATFNAKGTVHETNNLATVILTAGNVGVTQPVLNGHMLATGADTRAAIAGPTLTTTANPKGGFDSKVATVPTNAGSFDETVLAPGPWSTVATKAVVGAVVPALTKCKGAGNSTFRAIGDPNDAAMFAANRRHEDHHATDFLASFTAVFVPWDVNLKVAVAFGRSFHGATAAAAEAALFKAMGGTTEETADAFTASAAAAIGAFHGTAKGGPVGPPTGPVSDATCSTSSANFFNPG